MFCVLYLGVYVVSQGVVHGVGDKRIDARFLENGWHVNDWSSDRCCRMFFYSLRDGKGV